MKKTFLLFAVYCLLSTATPVFAQTEYKLLAPLPGYVKTTADDKTTAKPYIEGIFTLLIAIASGLAVLKIIFGGIKYMSTDAFEGKSEARTTIQNAIWGLLLAISAWLILYTVNPKLVEFNLKIPVQSIRTGSIVSGVAMTEAEIVADKVVRDKLEGASVSINAGPCLQGQGYGCTNLNDIPEDAIQGLITLKKDCSCGVTVSGGTEPGPHAEHGVGLSVVDLSNDATLRIWLASKNFLINNGEGAVVRLSSGDQVSLVYERAGQGRSTGDHWHVVF